jgi:hypothetical protein
MFWLMQLQKIFIGKQVWNDLFCAYFVVLNRLYVLLCRVLF